ncbi:TadA family conjugal transfer-associated ATPase [Lacisediminihabitans profunda]|uniref:TadA family conjugal transfer-associated ATPase n=1 Tax=Lacisediminihabitans profunda TaxID=2594790 RepID=A0A5C8UM01_9MICO|nr:TadA family conjugal transfer-associated ATPase [Lacisediminihabitans profunda]TXN28382.1 TadA family conjugal transfer-associated ATPase [Lacisediminihabitans profunda]
MFDRFDSLPAPSGPTGPDGPFERTPSPGPPERFVVGRPGGFRGRGAAHSVGVLDSDVSPSSGGHRSVDPMRRGIAGEELSDFGPLGPFVSDAAVTDVFVNGPGGVWVDRGRGAERERMPTVAESQLRELAVRLIALGGRHIDEATPCVDVRLHDGIRVHAVLPPISTGGTLLSIRLPRLERLGLGDLDATGFFSLVPLDAIDRLVARRENLLITGAAGTGKTTLLAALLARAAPADRIIAIEDVAELRVAHPHFVSLESRQANLEGAGQLGLERLVREALRMRPDRLVLGECRGGEIRELLAALNTGHDGGAGTLHANSLEDVPARLEALGALAGMSETAIARQTVSAIGTVLHLERAAGSRRLAQIGRFELDPRGRLIMVEAAGG